MVAKRTRRVVIEFDPRPLQRARAIRGLTLKVLAARTGFPLPTVWTVCAGRVKNSKALIEVCTVLGVDPASLFPDSPNGFVPGPAGGGPGGGEVAGGVGVGEAKTIKLPVSGGAGNETGPSTIAPQSRRRRAMA